MIEYRFFFFSSFIPHLCYWNKPWLLSSLVRGKIGALVYIRCGIKSDLIFTLFLRLPSAIAIAAVKMKLYFRVLVAQW